MQHLLIRNVRLPRTPDDGEQTSVLIADGRIIGIGESLPHPLTDTTEVDANGSYVIPSMLSLCNPRPQRIDNDYLNDLNFENATAGVTAIMTVSQSIEENMADMRKAAPQLLNHSFHFPLAQVALAESKLIHRIMVQEGVATAIVRLGDEKHYDIAEMKPHITAARILGLRVLYDMRGMVDKGERLRTLGELCASLREDKNNMAYVVGVEYDEELNMVKEGLGKYDIKAHISFDPFAKDGGDSSKLKAGDVVSALRHGQWCSLGLAYSATKALKEHWPDLTPEIVSRNKLPLLNAIDVEERLTAEELSEFAMGRPADFVGLKPTIGVVSEGASANLIVWNHNFTDDARFAVPRGNVRDVTLRGRIDYVIMNGKIVVGDKYNPNAICGHKLYCRIIK